MTQRAPRRWLVAGTTALVLTGLSTGVRAQQSDGTDAAAVPRAEGSQLPLEARTVRIDRTEGSWMSVDVSPDGARIVFDFLGDLYTVPIDGGDATQLTQGIAFDAQPRYSPDGSRIVFTSDRSGSDNIWTIAADGSDAKQVTKLEARRTESPEWTPDGEYIIASIANFHGHSTPQLHIFHRDGGNGVRPAAIRHGRDQGGPAGRAVRAALSAAAGDGPGKTDRKTPPTSTRHNAARYVQSERPIPDTRRPRL